MLLFQKVRIEGFTIQRCLISGDWNRGVPLYTEASLFQGVGIQEFHCIQRCLHFRWIPQYNRGVLIGGWNRGIPQYIEVSSFLVVGIEGFHSI